ncbi:MAG TPA: hypothetical protein VMG09_11285 [Bacteroidota bacterium]|nr:hypothetical protein [Bacteroidota bacterium]
MVRSLFYPFLLGCGLLLSGCYTGSYMHRSSWSHRERDTVAVMTNQDVVAMTKSGVKESVILNLVRRSQPAFQLNPDNIIALSDSGVTENVINAMIKSQDQAPEKAQSGQYSYGPYGSWYADYPWWYYGYIWDPWFYSPGFYSHYYYTRPYYSFGYHGYGYHGFTSGSHGYSGFGGGARGGHRR